MDKEKAKELRARFDEGSFLTGMRIYSSPLRFEEGKEVLDELLELYSRIDAAVRQIRNVEDPADASGRKAALRILEEAGLAQKIKCGC